MREDSVRRPEEDDEEEKEVVVRLLHARLARPWIPHEFDEPE